MDPDGMVAALLALEKSITRNLQQRARYAVDPSQFLTSEVDVDEKLGALHALAASPELFPKFAELQGIQSVLGLVTHDNADVSVSAVKLLAELTDTDVLVAETTVLDDAEALVNSLLQCEGLELLVQNLQRLDESVEEEQLGVHLTLKIIENVIEFRPALALVVSVSTLIVPFLLERINAKVFEDNKYYAAEVLSLLVQSDPANALRVGEMLKTFEGEPVNGLELLLLACSHYKKVDPTGLDEEECIENLYNVLCAVLLQEPNKQRFFELEGPALLVRVLHERRFSAAGALRALDFSLQSHRGNALQFVEHGGLKVIFPPFMGRGLYKDRRAAGRSGRSAVARRMVVEHSVSAIASVTLALLPRPKSMNRVRGSDVAAREEPEIVCKKPDSDADGSFAREDAACRLVHKFAEKDFEKVHRLCELFFRAEEELRLTEARISGAGFLDKIDVEDDRLAGGLGQIQQLSVILGAIFVSSASCRKQVSAKFHQVQRPIAVIGDVLEDYASALIEGGSEQRKNSTLGAREAAEKLSVWASVFE